MYARDTGSGVEVAHRADERFTFCSTFKVLAVAALLRDRSATDLNSVIRYRESDLLKSSVVTREHVADGLSLRALSDVAIRYSAGTAGNLLLREIGGPPGLTSFARSIGDTTTRMDRWEPDIVEATPGDGEGPGAVPAVGQLRAARAELGAAGVAAAAAAETRLRLGFLLMIVLRSHVSSVRG